MAINELTRIFPHATRKNDLPAHADQAGTNAAATDPVGAISKNKLTVFECAQTSKFLDFVNMCWSFNPHLGK